MQSEFWSRFDKYRNIAKKSIKEVSNEAGIEYGIIARLRWMGKIPEKSYQIEALAEAVGVEPNNLLTDEPFTPKEVTPEGKVYSEFWSRFDNYRNIAKKSIKEISDETGIEYGVLARLRWKNEAPSKIQQIEALASALGVTTNELYYGKKNEMRRKKNDKEGYEEYELYRDVIDDFMKLTKRQKEVIKETIKTFLADREKNEVQ